MPGGWPPTPSRSTTPFASPRPGPARHGPTVLPRARPTTRPRQKINVPCNPCIMHSHFVQRTNERTARKFTSHLAHGRASFLLFRVLSLSLALSYSLPPLFFFLPLFLVPISVSFPLSPRPSLAREFASGNAPALTNSRPRSLVLSSGRFTISRFPLAPLFHFPGPPRPVLPASSKFRLEIIKLHALTRTCVVRTDGPSPGESPSPSTLPLFRSCDLL